MTRTDDPRWSIPVADLLAHRVAQTPDLVLARDETGRALTFVELGTYAARVATELAAHGVGESSRVAWQLPTWLETLVVTSALVKLRAVQVPLPYSYRRHELEAAVEQTDVELLITPDRWRGHDYAATAAEVAAGHPRLSRAVVVPGRPGSLSGLAWSAPSTGTSTGPGQETRGGAGPVAEPDLRWVFFTSGTSSAPKGARHTDRSVTVAATTMADALALTSADRSAIAFPLGHIGGVAWLIAALQTGCALLLAEHFDDAAIDAFDAHGVTLAGVSTAFHLAYRDRARADPGRRLFADVRGYPGGAATKPPTLHHELRTEIGGIGILSGYGLTECPMITMSGVTDADDKLSATEGRPGPGVVVELRHLMTGAVLEPGEPGEIWVQAPQLFLGYLRDEDTREVMDERGFFRTGDIGFIDAEGYIVISGRLKDVIIRKGENISAKEVEDHIFAHPDVADVAVVGLADDKVGERCCAVIVTKPDHPDPTVEGLGAFLRERGLMTQKWPEQIQIRPALPRNAAGKVLKHDLIRELTVTHPEG
jgi:acyl-CoA synthetase (AMP-forming)/AMP-acid ligase II